MRASIRFVIVAALTVGLTGVAAAAPANGARRDLHYADAFDFQVENWCGGGITVRQAGEYHGIVSFRRGVGGPELFSITTHGSETITNVANGKSLLILENGAGKEHHVTDNGDGTITVVESFSGIDRVYGPDGHLLAQETGTTWRQFVVDLGNPDDPDDDVLQNEDVVKRTGLRAGSADCDVVVAALS